MSKNLTFKPRMLGFICNWCCYGGADLAGVSRFQYPHYIRLIRIMCSARVDAAHIIRAFSNGQDAVFVGGCHLNDCHYVTNGNYDALSMVSICKKVLAHVGIYPERLRLEWVSAGEGIRFANIMNEFGPQIQKLGPLGTGEGIDKQVLSLRLKAAARLIPYIKLVQMERMRIPVRSEEAYHAFFNGDDFNRLFNELIAEKLTISQMLLLLEEKALSTGEIAGKLGLSPSDVARHIHKSLQQGLIRYDVERKCYSLAR